MTMVLEDEPLTSGSGRVAGTVVGHGEAAPALEQTGSADSIRKYRVLVVDDNQALRETINDILSTQGYVVTEAEDGEAGLRHLASAPIDVLVLDLYMPRLSGLELLRRIEPPPPVVIICSAFEYVTPAELREQAGSKVFRSLRKPVPPITLISVVAEAIQELERGPQDR